jgi:hypothetical protein
MKLLTETIQLYSDEAAELLKAARPKKRSSKADKAAILAEPFPDPWLRPLLNCPGPILYQQKQWLEVRIPLTHFADPRFKSYTSRLAQIRDELARRQRTKKEKRRRQRRNRKRNRFTNSFNNRGHFP